MCAPRGERQRERACKSMYRETRQRARQKDRDGVAGNTQQGARGTDVKLRWIEKKGKRGARVRKEREHAAWS